MWVTAMRVTKRPVVEYWECRTERLRQICDSVELNEAAATLHDATGVEHIELELVSITDWDLLLAWKDPAGRGLQRPSCGILLTELIFFIIQQLLSLLQAAQV
ncbi:unnamed protein product [Menidia menidia]|uniref:(Atlantic silverside) hypothetical protein n=1 Tax=Menidia menidia TaxID=238744 RepID=A0A8S4AA89_9TELE|nr:unnamed protein product [Menidia menidia]